MLMSAYGVRAAQTKLRPLPFTAMTEAIASGEVDALFLVSAAPVLALEDLARRTPVTVVPIAGPTADKIAEVLPFYSHGVVPAGTYGAMTDVPTLDVGIVLVARDSLDDTLGFSMARAIWHERNVPLFQNGHPSGKLMVRDQAAEGFILPLHSGAARYYVGQGLDIPVENQPVPATPVRVNMPNSRSS
jgi:TRAP transporter TAXI family solute receptor